MDVFALLRTGNSRRASDLHMVVGSPATYRIDGSLVPVDGMAALTPEDINEGFLQLTTPEERENFIQHQEKDLISQSAQFGRPQRKQADQPAIAGVFRTGQFPQARPLGVL